MKKGPKSPRPAAAAESTDAESGTEGDSVRRSLYALKVMLDRGLIDEAEYERRRAALAGGA